MLLLGVMALLLLSPLNRGSFFVGAQLTETIGSGLLVAAWALTVIWGKAAIPWKSGILIGLGILVLAYGVALWGAIHPSTAVLSVLLRLDELALALSAGVVAMRRWGGEVLSWALVAAGWLVGGYGLLAEVGYVHYTDAVYGGRLSSFFQYPNATAAYLLLALFTSMGLAMRGKAQGKWWVGVIGLALGAGLFPPFLLAKSRATWLLLPFLVVLFVVAMPRGQRARSALYSLSTLLGGGVGVGLFILGTHSHQDLVALVGEVLGALVAGGLGLLTERILSSAKRGLWMGLGAGVVVLGMLGYVGMAMLRPLSLHPGQTFSAPAAVLPGTGPVRVVVNSVGSPGGQVAIYGMTQSGSKHLLGTVPVGGGVVQPDSQTVSLLVTLQGPKAGVTTFRNVQLIGRSHTEMVNWTWAKLIPQSLYLRLININANQLSVWERFIYWHDAIQIWLQRPLTGWGGGGWAALYHRYQSFGYTSNQAHSALLQTADAAGLLGVIGYVWMWTGMGIAWWRLRRKGHPVAVWAGGLGTGLAAIGLHSLMDFDLSLEAVTFALMVGLGTLAGMDAAREGAREEAPGFLGRSVVFGGAAVLGVSLSIYSGVLLSGHLAANAGLAAVRVHNYAAALTDFQAAVKRQPLSSENHLMLGQMMAAEGQAQKNTTLSQGAFPQLLQALQLDSTNVSVQNLVAQAYFRGGQIAPGLSQLQQAVQDNPYSPVAWQNLTQVQGELMAYDLGHKDPAGALQSLRSLLSIPAQIQAKVNAIPSVVPASMRMPVMPPMIALWVGAGDIVAGQTSKGMAQVSQAQSVSSLQAQALAWEVVGANASGNKAQAAAATKTLVGLGQTALSSLAMANQVYVGLHNQAVKAGL